MPKEKVFGEVSTSLVAAGAYYKPNFLKTAGGLGEESVPKTDVEETCVVNSICLSRKSVRVFVTCLTVCNHRQSKSSR